MATTYSEKERLLMHNGSIVTGTFTTTGTGGAIVTGQVLVYKIDIVGTTGAIGAFTTGAMPLTSGGFFFTTTGVVSGIYSSVGVGM